MLIDIVPNHCSIEHPWFTAALAAGPGSPERERFHFADGRGEHGQAAAEQLVLDLRRVGVAAGPGPDGAPGQWYLHTFAPEQADLNWAHPGVQEHFEQVLRFWFERGVDGLRIDVAHGLHKKQGLPDHPWALQDELTGDPVNPYAWDQPEVHDVWRRWRAIAQELHRRDRPRTGPHRRGRRPGRRPAGGLPAPDELTDPMFHRTGALGAGGGLAGAVRAEQREDAAPLDLEVDATQHVQTPFKDFSRPCTAMADPVGAAALF